MAGYAVKGKVVLITGANRGIGKALVEAFVEKGAAKVYAAVRTLSTAQPLVDKNAGLVFPLAMDLSKPDSIKSAAKEAGDVEIVVNNAGILSYTQPLAEDAVQQLQKEMDVNVYGFMNVAQAFAPILKANGGGALCQVNSVGSLRCPLTSVSTYAASKAASYSMTQALRVRLKEQNTFVMSVHPGPVKTDMVMGREDAGELAMETPDVVAKEVILSLEAGDFLCFPDALSKNLARAYQPFADYVFGQGKVY